MSAAVPRWRFGEPVGPLAELLARGGVLAIPTESSYGLAADPRSEAGVERIFRIKGRDGRKPLPVVIAGPDQLPALGIDPAHPALAAVARHWPAPLAICLPLARPLPAAAGGSTLAVRIPAHEPLRQLVQDLGMPLTATSANLSGLPPLLEPSGAMHLLAGEDAVVVDGGTLKGGRPSTLVEWQPQGGLGVLRAGAFAIERLHPRRTDA